MDRNKLVAFSGMKNYQVSEEDPDVRGWSVVSREGHSYGTVRDMLVNPERMKVEYFTVGEGSFVPAASAHVDRKGKRLVLSDASAIEGGAATRSSYSERATEGVNTDESTRLTRAEEEVRIGTREVESGEVVIAKHVERDRISEDIPVARERVRVERRPVSDTSDSADIREDEIRIPLVEEELVVEKRPVVKEELVISKERVTNTQRVDTEVRRERFDIEGDTELVEDSGEPHRRGR